MYVGGGGYTRGATPEKSCYFPMHRHKLPSSPFLVALSPLPHSHRQRRPQERQQDDPRQWLTPERLQTFTGAH